MRVERGTRAFITGASRGIGRLARAGAGRPRRRARASPPAPRRSSTSSPPRSPGAHHVLACDVASSSSVEQALAAFNDAAGGIDLLVANAGITHYGPYREQSLDDQLQMSEVNWHGTLRTVHHGAALPARPRPWPRRRRLLGRRLPLLPVGRRLRRHEGRAADVRRGAAPRAGGHRRLADRRLPGRDRDLAARPREGAHARLVQGRPERRERRRARAQDRRRGRGATRARCIYPPLVRLLQVMHNASPKASDALLRRLRGDSAAPRRG